MRLNKIKNMFYSFCNYIYNHSTLISLPNIYIVTSFNLFYKI